MQRTLSRLFLVRVITTLSMGGSGGRQVGIHGCILDGNFCRGHIIWALSGFFITSAGHLPTLKPV